jgi:hypothetical protein
MGANPHLSISHAAKAFACSGIYIKESPVYLAEDIIAPGGPSLPVWSFLTAISLAIIALFGQQLTAKREARAARDEASKASKSSLKAAENTTNISNGFVSRMDSKLDRVIQQQYDLLEWQREHQEWHMRAERRETK